MSSPRMLPYGRQSIDDSDIAAVAAVLRGDFLTTGPAVPAFEEKFAEAVGAPHAIACSSGTAALHIAAVAAGLGPGTAAIVPAVTFLATANAPRLAGAEIVFADVDPDSGLMRAGDMEDAIERAARSGLDVRAALPVHLGGQTVDLEAIAAVAAREGLCLIEDACHAIGTRYGGHTVGSGAHSAMTAFSFHPVKTIAMGEGGAVTTRDAALAERLRRLRNHGMVRDATAFECEEQAFGADGQPNPWYYEMPEIGLNYRASDIHCALGLSQLSRLPQFVAKRRDLVARYDALLSATNLPVRRTSVREGVDACWHLYAVLIDFAVAGRDRSSVMKALGELGVGTQVHYIPLHLQPYYRRRYGALSLPGAERYYAGCLSLPLFPQMEASDVDRVVASLAEVLG